MKKVFLSLLAASFLAIGTNEVNAQARYRTALGLGIDLGDGPTLVGPQIKHFFDGANAGNAQVLFGDDVTVLGVDYSYNQAIAGTNGLNWYVGVGPQLAFIDGGRWWYDDRNDDRTYFALRPAAGLEFKIPSAPLAFHFDWKPWWNLSNRSNFEPARFTLGFKFTLN
ncbi:MULTISPECIES: hypothetical protein [Sphingobacterium]|uniref:Outer membrane protein beta-barrel domain-containing protein n=2 Tax=Sphingobacterium TaxID=28453 RepID=A0A2S9JSD1_9SPHI|nr:MULTISPECIES: hypothetical protein [Sphingobacterium]PRD44149.1 hypothetical protein C5745_19465 [Sphingobacterium haloxyli]PRD56207.1 hypothetical protein C5749_02735 [Sphingobacterium gobiense]